MNYPQGPYGQEQPRHHPGYPPHQGYPPQQPGYPAQQAYPQQPPGYPAQPGYQPYGGYPYPGAAPAKPSSATGITAVVLAGLGALSNLGAGALALLGLVGLSALSADSAYANASSAASGAFAVLIFVVLLGIAAGILLAGGTVTLLQRKMIGRWLVVGGCALTLIQSLISFSLAAAVAGPYGSFGGGNFFSILGLVFPIATLVLVLLPSTTAWIRSRSEPIGSY